MIKRVLVTGASGFIGRQTLPLLVERGYEVHAASYHRQLDVPHVHWHSFDVLDASLHRDFFLCIRPTHVLHFAWIATPGEYWTSPLNEKWRNATENLFLCAAEHGVQRFVASGTCAEYDWTSGYCKENVTPLLPLSPYGVAKNQVAQVLMNFSRNDSTTAWGRIFFLYGSYENPKRFISSLILSLLQGKDAHCLHGNLKRDFLHVQDVASAFVALLESNVTGPVNIASGTLHTLRDVALIIGRIMKANSHLSFGELENSINNPPCIEASVGRLFDEVGWRPTLSLEQGIEETITWWKNHGTKLMHDL